MHALNVTGESANKITLATKGFGIREKAHEKSINRTSSYVIFHGSIYIIRGKFSAADEEDIIYTA